MVLDTAKGIEPQTLKLFEVCRTARLPVLTFLNKYDRPGREPLELLDEIEKQIGLRPTPATWPVGIAGDLRGVIDRRTGVFIRFTRTDRGASLAPEDDRADRRRRAPRRAPPGSTAVDEIGLLDAVGADVDLPSFLAGESTPVFVGSALTNFGVRMLLDAVVDLAPPPSPTVDDAGTPRPLDSPVLGVRVQGPGEHGPVAPRPHRVRPHLLGTLRARHDGDHVRPHAAAARHQVRHHGVRGRPRNDRRGVPGRRGRPRQRHRRCNSATRCTTATPVDVPADPTVRARGVRHRPPARHRPRQAVPQGPRAARRGGRGAGAARPRPATPSPILAAVGQLQFEVFAHRLGSEFGAPTEILSAAVPGHPAAPTRRRRERLRDIGGIRILRRSDGELVALFENRYRLARLQADEPELTLEPLVAGALDAGLMPAATR